MDSGNRKAAGMVPEHLALVRSLAVRIWRTLPIVADVNDLFQAGALGLLDAVRDYSAAEDGDFEIYAKRRIQDAIMDSLSQLDGAPSCARPLRPRPDPIARDVDSRLGVDQAAAANTSRNCVKVVVGNPRRRRPLKGSAEIAASPDSQPDYICEHNELRRTLARVAAKLPKRYRSILTLYYEKEATLKQISSLLGVSEVRISQLRRKALRQMSAELEARGYARPPAEAFS